MRLMCQADDTQYAIKRDLKPNPCGEAQLGYSQGKENGLDLSMVCPIDDDIRQSQYDPISHRIPGWEQMNKVNYYQVMILV